MAGVALRPRGAGPSRPASGTGSAAARRTRRARSARRRCSAAAPRSLRSQATPAQPDQHVRRAAQAGGLGPAARRGQGLARRRVGVAQPALGQSRGRPGRSCSRGRRRCGRPCAVPRGRRRSRARAASRSPMLQDARPDRAEAAAWTRSSPSACQAERAVGVRDGAGGVARSLRARAARYISMRAGISARSSPSSTTSSSSGSRSWLLDVGAAAPRRRRRRCWTSGHRPGPWRGPDGCGAPYSGRSSTQPRITASRRSRASAGTASSTRSAARSTSPAASACRTAGTGSPARVVPTAGAAVELRRRGRAARPAGARAGRRRRGGGSGTSAAGRPAAPRTGCGAPATRASGRCRTSAGDRVAERAGQPLEDRGVEQEGADLVGLPVEHLLDEVVHDVPVVAGEAGDELATGRRDRAATAPRAGARRSSPRCRRPARRRRCGRQVEPRRAGEVRRRLLLR